MSDAQSTTDVSAKPNMAAAYGAIVKVAMVLLVIVEVAGYIYAGFFGLLARDAIETLLAAAQFSDVLAIENSLLGLTLAPFTYGLLAAIGPLIGWWIYSRIDKPQQSMVGWGSATLFAVSYVLIGLVVQGALGRLTAVFDVLATVIGLALIVVYTVFFMGIGFNIAKLFRLKL
ncbi:MAG: hypothetical protein WDN06_10315 [Asticcacaulis sp.]